MKVVVDPILAQYYGRRTNLLGSLYLLSMTAGAKILWQGLSPFRDLRALGGTQLLPGRSSGQSFDPEIAVNAAFGEALERLGASFVPRQTLVRGTHAELSRTHLLPSLQELRLFSTEQIRQCEQTLGRPFEFQHPQGDVMLDWMPGIQFAGEQQQEILYPYDRLALNFARSRFDLTTTNGNALGSSANQAISAALAEVVERHALLYHWWHTKPAPIFSTAETLTADPQNPAAEILRLAGERLLILDFSDVWKVPTFAALFLGRPELHEPAFAMGTCCHADPRQALSKSVIEGYRVFFDQTLVLQVRKPKSIRPPYDNSIHNFDDVSQFYASEDSRSAMRFLLEGPRPGAAALRERLRQSKTPIDKKLLQDGKKIYQFDLTPADLAMGGLHLYRVVMPDAIPLNLAHRTRPFGCPALSQYSLDELNPMPHPCP